MKVLVRGNHENIVEFSSKFSELKFDTDEEYSTGLDLFVYDVVFDFLIDDSPDNLDMYAGESDLVVFMNAVKSSLLEYSSYLGHNFQFTMVGFNGLPTFFDRSILELTALREEDNLKIQQLAKQLEFEFILVDDRVGMVTPRVVCMIINEAYYTEQEGTAEREAIDHAMKLGTNYPYGPFEWATKIGIQHVYELLEALYNDTHDARYKICPLLKKEYLKEV